MIIKKSECIKLSLDPNEVEKLYSIRLDASFERNTGNNLTVFIKEIARKEDNSKVTKMQMAKELAKELGYEYYSTVSIDIQCRGNWEASDDGYSGHDILNKYISSINLDIIKR